MDFSALLQQAQTHNAEALARLKQLEDSNPVDFINLLSQELNNNTKPASLRGFAGIVLKNQFSAKNKQLNEKKQAVWTSLDINLKNQVKERSFYALADPSQEVRRSAAQVLSRIAIIEIPRRESDELINIMVSSMTSENAGLRQGILDTLGYVCEETDPSSATDYSDKILTAVVQGMRKEEKEDRVRVSGANALLGALEFSKPNFERAQERDYLMQVICEGTIAPSTDLKVKCLQCLVKIATLYYDKLMTWIQNIFNITIGAIKNEKEDVALQAIEFWATICDVETDLLIEAAESPQIKVPPEKQCQHFIKKSASYLVTALCESLTKQEEDQEEEIWNVSSAAGNCLSLIAGTIQNDVIQYIMPFVQNNISSTDWHFREAAVFAFGSMLDGPKEHSPIRELVKEALGPKILLSKLTDNVELVRDTAAWTLGRICTFHVGSNQVRSKLPDVIRCFIQSLKDTPRVASKVCWAIHNLAEQFDPAFEDTTPLTPFFNELIKELLIVTVRNDADESFLRAAAYSAINMLIQHSEDDSRNAVLALVPELLKRLALTFNGNLQMEDPERLGELRGYLCGTLRACSMVLIEGALPQALADEMMHAYLKVWATTRGASVVEEVLVAIGRLASAVGPEFDRYMIVDFTNGLLSALKNSEELSVCSSAIEVVGDICRAIGDKMTKISDTVITILIEHLKNPHISSDIKPLVLACIGDIALAIGSKFEPYFIVVMDMLVQASGYEIKDPTDLDLVENINQLRENIFETYTSIIQALVAENKAEMVSPYVEPILVFVDRIWNDGTRNETVTRGAVGILGDLASALGPRIKGFLVNPQVGNIIQDCCASQDQQTKEIALWARDIISQIN
eukprot:TRINITY_DN4965_c0_g2_i2.p1 TRINITY_DN4965_c0_g2~~TRINITY_DN4965_c0_g2_i2.p1  ORF type:complete len:856 (+),score=207.44 TRINITY_DN4965_c0_g2_i2:218-2785(+)